MSPKRVLIVGGVAGGASCAARLRRLDEQAEIVVFEKGPYPSFANCGLPYYIAPSRTGLDLHCIEAPQRSPGSRACCFSACAGSSTTQGRLTTRV